MKNSSIVVGLGILTVAILAAEGTLTRIWRGIISAKMPSAAGMPSGNVPGGSTNISAPDNGVVSENPASSGSWGNSAVPSQPNGVDPKGAISNLFGGGSPQQTTLFPIYPIGWDNNPLNDVFYNWPAGKQTEWAYFLQCYQEHGDIAMCRNVALNAKG